MRDVIVGKHERKLVPMGRSRVQISVYRLAILTESFMVFLIPSTYNPG
jgi:hypothetical protein